MSTLPEITVRIAADGCADCAGVCTCAATGAPLTSSDVATQRLTHSAMTTARVVRPTDSRLPCTPRRPHVLTCATGLTNRTHARVAGDRARRVSKERQRGVGAGFGDQFG